MKGNQSNSLDKNEGEQNGKSSGNELEVVKPLKLKLVDIEKLLDPKLLKDKPKVNQTKTTQPEKRSLDRNAKRSDSIVYIDSDTEESSSDEPLSVRSSRSSRSGRTRNKSNTSKSASAGSSHKISLPRSTATPKLTDAQKQKLIKEKCTPCRVKVKKLPKNLQSFMVNKGLSEIRNLKNEVIRVNANTSADGSSSGSGSKKHVSFDLKVNKSAASTVKAKKKIISSSSSDDESSTDNLKMLKTKTSQKNKPSKSNKLNDNEENRGKRRQENTTVNIISSDSDSQKSKSNDKSKKKTETLKNVNNRFSKKIISSSDDDFVLSNIKKNGKPNDTEESKDNTKKKTKDNGRDESKMGKDTSSSSEPKKSTQNDKKTEDAGSSISENLNSKSSKGKVTDSDSDKRVTKVQNDETNIENRKSVKATTSRKKSKTVLSSSDDDDDLTFSNVTKKKCLLNAENKKDTENAESDDDENKKPIKRVNKRRRVSDSSFEGSDSSENEEKSLKLNKSRNKNDDNETDSDEIFQPKPKIFKKTSRKKSTSNEEDEISDEEKPKQKRKRKRIKVVKDSDSSDGEGGKKDSPNKGRKNIRKVLKEKNLQVETKEANQLETERKKRIEERQKLYNSIFEEEIEQIKELEKLVLDFDPDTKEELVTVDKKLLKKLKPHQGQGIKFMWDACFESIQQTNSTTGSGCILAHCMGLGKSLQVVALAHTLLSHEETNVKRVLVIAPLSTVLNWVNEFKIWLKHCEANKDIEIFEISKFKKNIERAYKLQEWYEWGGVMIMGYDMFRNLVTSASGRMRKKMKEQITTSLIDPGPDLVVCDEGHLLKNEKTSLSKAVNQLKTLRRIVLTGTPLQNNLKEYYCMVQFVKPNLLGKYTEYLNRFVNPITNGQYTDSTPFDIQLMKRRSHVLHKMLDGCVQRRDYSVLAPFLPPKHEFVLFIQMTELQVKLYKHYMENRANDLEDGTKKRSAILFADFQNLQRIWTHPRVLRYNSDRYETEQQKKRDLMSEEESEGSLKDFIDDSEDEHESTPHVTSASDSENSVHTDEGKKKMLGRKTRNTLKLLGEKIEEPVSEPIKYENPTEWWTPLVDEADLDNLEVSGKLMFLFSMLNMCDKIGDKLLVFSQSLYSLDVIEHFLSLIDENQQKGDEGDPKLAEYSGSWSLGLDYFRLDGSTSIENRNSACNHFNNPDNTRARLFLISTRAGGLGINLVAANRVIIFDVSWNPSHDIQSIFRIYRFGQLKPCYIYRFISLGTMEEKIYERQVTKLAISKRVIDEQQIDRHYKENDLLELYKMDELVPSVPRSLPLLPKDRLFAELLQKHEKVVYKYHEHETLLENKEEETLNEDERKAAWEEFEAEKNRPVNQVPVQRFGAATTSNMVCGFRTEVLLRLLTRKARQENPTFTDMQLGHVVPILLRELSEQMEKGISNMYHELLKIQSELDAEDMWKRQLAYGQLPNPYANFMGNVINPMYHAANMVNLQTQPMQNNRFMFDPNTVIELDD